MKDPELGNVYKILIKIYINAEISKNMMKDNIIMYGLGKIYIPKNLVMKILKYFHDTNYFAHQ